MDRNQVIGFSLLAVLAFGYFFMSSKDQKKFEELKKNQQDSIKTIQKVVVQDTNKSTNTTAKLDSNQLIQMGDYASILQGKNQDVVLENDVVKITFATKGGSPKAVELKKFKTFSKKEENKKPLYIFNGEENYIDFVLSFTDKIIHTKDIYFTPTNTANSLTMTAGDITYTYTLKVGEYMLDYQINVGGSKLNSSKSIDAIWNTKILHTEQDLKNERQYAHFYYKEHESKEIDYYTIKSEKQETYDKKMSWISADAQYFKSALLATNGFENVKAKTQFDENNDSNIVFNQFTNFNIATNVPIKLQWYMGPNDYNILKKYDNGLEETVQMGRGIFEFVKYINRYAVLPVFNFLEKFISNYGLLILVMTIIIRILLSFFTYKSYLSQAKMQALKPELDQLKAKYGDDQTKFGAEQMKLYQTAGVNPLGGCLPTLFQMPFLIAMYSFFPSLIALRQKNFLWASDLSTYDSILDFSFNIPAYGNHISLFTLLFTATSLLLAFSSSSMTNDQGNPALKYMPYIMPIMFLGFFNSFSSGLTFYYFCSNLLTLLIQWYIKKFVIDHDKIKLELEANKKKPASQSKFAQKMAELQTQNEERKKKLGQK